MMSSFLLPAQVGPDAILAQTPKQNGRIGTLPMLYRYTPHALVLAIVGIMAGCSSTPPQNSAHKIPNKKNHSTQSRSNPQDNLDLESADSLEELLQATDMEAVEGDRLAVLRYGNLWNRIRVGYRLDLSVENPRISAQRNWFVSRQPYIDRLSARASRYFYYTVTEAERRGIPTELALLPVIESSYDPFATSNASAAGMWQFIPSTGRIYGLRQDSYYDGRRDVVESTRAAYDFLTSLYQKFGSWELALASYNAGPGRIQQAINRNIAQGLPTDYWSLKLPEETMNYVPRFIAVAQIIKNPESYGIQLNSIANRPHFRAVTLQGPVDLAKIVETTGLTSKEIFELNPAFLQGVTAPNGPYRVLIPTSLSASVDARLKNLPTVDPSRFGVTDTGSLLAMNQPITQTITQTITRSDGKTSTAVSTPQAAAIMAAGNVVSSSKTANITESVTVRGNQRIPTNADALAAMANQASVPSQTNVQKAVANVNNSANAVQSQSTATQLASNIPAPVVAKTDATTMTITTRPASTVQPIVSNPNVSATNITASNTTAPVDSSAPVTQSPIIVAPATTLNSAPIVAVAIDPKSADIKNGSLPNLSADDKNKVVTEIRSITSSSTPVVDPLDGKIQLTAIQTQQSVLDKQGETRSLSYDQPYLKSPTATDIKTHKLTPVETKVVADVKVSDKPKGVRTIYIVKAGDTLLNVATKAGLAWRDIAKWNQMDANANLITGTPLYLYGAKKIVETPTTYVVQAGDTLTDVAAQFNLTNRELADRNNLKVTSNLITGTRLNLVANTDSATSKDSTGKLADKVSDSTASNAKSSTIKTDDYTIKRGDTLAKIASRYNLSVGNLAKLNDIPATTSLLVGDTISVPAIELPNKKSSAKDDKPSTEKTPTSDYKVRSGETLARIAAKHGLTVVALADLNDIPADTRIQAGDTISVPEPEKPVAKKKSHR
ncbi:LysM peptidoglycan-binding domain-containing protein [Aquirhabdus sp.]|uniref:LysM peptidoglycan-binding domain-containing protein n=1 Tax=Aquirhabdus sp. TaxID=2824160 RepID=UPI00396C4E5B